VSDWYMCTHVARAVLHDRYWFVFLGLSEGHRFVTRSKTGHLAPKQFADSVMPTVSLKTALKASLADMEASDLGRMTRSRTAVNASFIVTSLPGFFRLGELFFFCYLNVDILLNYFKNRTYRSHWSRFL